MMKHLKSYLKELAQDGVCLAFSGGVDSALLLALLAEEPRVLAVTFASELQTPTELEIARQLACRYQIKHQLLEVDIFADEHLRFNPLDRCYRCKYQLFNALKQLAKSQKLRYVIDGTNSDDLKVHRPGRRALEELGIISPLAKLGISKAEVRNYAQELGLSVAQRASSPCLATRLPYGSELKAELLEQIAAGESVLQEFGFSEVRLRLHNDVARLELSKGDFGKILEMQEIVISRLKSLKFRYITLDLEGFRSGSMDDEN